MSSMLERAEIIADEVLFPAALEVDVKGVIPTSHFNLLAEEGFYGLAAPPDESGLKVDFPTVLKIIEILAGGCLATTFTWLQHFGVVQSLSSTTNSELRERYFQATLRGELRCGVAFAGAAAQPPRLLATPTNDGWRLNGDTPFVTGWGIVDLLLVMARHSTGRAEGTILSGLIEARPGHGITSQELQLVAVQGSNTVRLRFEDYFLPKEKVTSEISYFDFLATQLLGLRVNAGLAMGVAGRCIRMIRDAGQPQLAQLLQDRQDMVRGQLDAGLNDSRTMAAARAAASELAYRAAGLLVTAGGSSGILKHHHAQRLVREATFTLVAAGRQKIKENLLQLFAQLPE